MRAFWTYDMGNGITGARLGWSLAGPPLMQVYCYIFGRTMVDTGQSRMAREALAFARAHGVERIFLTHHHEDHSGNAALIRRKLGVRVFGHDQARAKLTAPYAILPYQTYIWGATTPVPVVPLAHEAQTELGVMRAVHTPGHSRDHLVYHLPDQGLLFSGDLYLGDRIRYFRSDEDMGAQIASLETVVALDFDILLCSHNPRLARGRAHLARKLDFLKNLYGAIIELWKKGVPEKRIFRELGLKEARLIRLICFGNVSLANGVRSAVRHYEKTNCRR